MPSLSLAAHRTAVDDGGLEAGSGIADEVDRRGAAALGAVYEHVGELDVAAIGFGHEALDVRVVGAAEDFHSTLNLPAPTPLSDVCVTFMAKSSPEERSLALSGTNMRRPGVGVAGDVAHLGKVADAVREPDGVAAHGVVLGGGDGRACHAGGIVDGDLVDPAVHVRSPGFLNRGEVIAVEAETVQRQNVSAQIRSRRVGIVKVAVPLEGARDAPLLASEVGVPRGNGSAQVAMRPPLEKSALWIFLTVRIPAELEDLDVRGAVLEMHNGPDSLRTGGVAGLEERHEILHVGNLGVAVGFADGRRSGVGLAFFIHAGDCGHARESRRVIDIRAGCVRSGRR